MKHRNNTIERLTAYVESLHPIIYINHFDFYLTDELIESMDIKAHILEYSNSSGIVEFKSKRSLVECDIISFLKRALDAGYKDNTFILLKDIKEELEKPVVVSLLKQIAENIFYKEDYHATIFIVSNVVVIPKELEPYITLFDIPLPSYKEIEDLIKEFMDEENIDLDVVGDLARSFKGLNEFQIKQILYLAYLDEGQIDENDKSLVLEEKEQFIKKSNLLDLINSSENIDNIGGLENLKEWLNRKQKVFSALDRAIKSGVDIPKGILIVGMPGCGKSLTAKATATLFEIPLVRLDVGRLLGKYVGESENNMRKALALAEAISPCVLWIDELEKSFAGAGGDGANDVTTRLFGQFLTWMQEKENSVFIVATANDVTAMPPEFLRKGRFDELFFVDLPCSVERENIFRIHIKKRKQSLKNIDLGSLSARTEGFSGADIESVVKEAIENNFIDEKKILETEDLIKAINNTTSISISLKDKIDGIREKISKMEIKNASSGKVLDYGK